MTNHGATGHNGGPEMEDEKPLSAADLQPLLNKHVPMIRKLENERAVAASRVTEAKKAAKDDGLDPATMGLIVKLSKLDPEDREDYLRKIDVYAAAMKYY